MNRKHSRDHSDSEYNIVYGADRKWAEFIGNEKIHWQKTNIHTNTQLCFFYFPSDLLRIQTIRDNMCNPMCLQFLFWYFCHAFVMWSMKSTYYLLTYLLMLIVTVNARKSGTVVATSLKSAIWHHRGVLKRYTAHLYMTPTFIIRVCFLLCFTQATWSIGDCVTQCCWRRRRCERELHAKGFRIFKRKNMFLFRSLALFTITRGLTAA